MQGTIRTLHPPKSMQKRIRYVFGTMTLILTFFQLQLTIVPSQLARFPAISIHNSDDELCYTVIRSGELFQLHRPIRLEVL